MAGYAGHSLMLVFLKCGNCHEEKYCRINRVRLQQPSVTQSLRQIRNEQSDGMISEFQTGSITLDTSLLVGRTAGTGGICYGVSASNRVA
jgi:hypothetical protein